MASRNVFMNLVRSFVTKSPELDARALATSGESKETSTGLGGFFRIFLHVTADTVARDNEQISRIESGAATPEELVGIADGRTATSSSAQGLAQMQLSSYDD